MSGALVEAHNINFRRAGRDILVGVSLEVQRGESVALTGPSGSGKTALLTLIAGLEQADTGTLAIAVDASEIGLVLQGYALVGLLTVEENVAMPLLTPGRTPVPPTTVHARVGHALDAVDLQPVAGKLVETLSGGQQQRAAIARALVTTPTLLLADEPSSALDPKTRQKVLNALLELHRNGTTLIIATHDQAVADALGRQVALEDGRIPTRPTP